MYRRQNNARRDDTQTGENQHISLSLFDCLFLSPVSSLHRHNIHTRSSNMYGANNSYLPTQVYGGTLDIFNIGYFRRLPPQQQFETLEDGEMGV